MSLNMWGCLIPSQTLPLLFPKWWVVVEDANIFRMLPCENLSPGHWVCSFLDQLFGNYHLCRYVGPGLLLYTTLKFLWKRQMLLCWPSYPKLLCLCLSKCQCQSRAHSSICHDTGGPHERVILVYGSAILSLWRSTRHLRRFHIWIPLKQLRLHYC